MEAEFDERRKVAQYKEPESEGLDDKKREAYLDLIMQIDKIEDEREKRIASNKKQEGIDLWVEMAAILFHIGGHFAYCMMGWMFTNTSCMLWYSLTHEPILFQ